MFHIIDSVGVHKTLAPSLVVSFEQANISENEFVDNALSAADSIVFSKWDLVELVKLTSGFKSSIMLCFIKYQDFAVNRFQVNCMKESVMYYSACHFVNPCIDLRG